MSGSGPLPLLRACGHSYLKALAILEGFSGTPYRVGSGVPGLSASVSPICTVGEVDGERAWALKSETRPIPPSHGCEVTSPFGPQFPCL